MLFSHNELQALLHPHSPPPTKTSWYYSKNKRLEIKPPHAKSVFLKILGQRIWAGFFDAAPKQKVNIQSNGYQDKWIR